MDRFRDRSAAQPPSLERRPTMTSTRWLTLVGFTMLVVACGGPVSLGTTSQNLGKDSDAGDSGAVCPAGACGPALGMPSRVCPDGSVGGSTGRCLSTPTGCGWEVRECPTA